MKTSYTAMMAAAAVATAISITVVEGFSVAPCHIMSATKVSSSSTRLHFFKGGSGAKDLDEEVRAHVRDERNKLLMNR